ncbi:hypothetical protein DMA11_05925 [Marinilabiliaceae bacterium JC017]|nr:hypothetical protein DMA11_05925 [Marinilabiliaceae bacterium JC017]
MWKINFIIDWVYHLKETIKCSPTRIGLGGVRKSGIFITIRDIGYDSLRLGWKKIETGGNTIEIN